MSSNPLMMGYGGGDHSNLSRSCFGFRDIWPQSCGQTNRHSRWVTIRVR